MKHRAVGLLVAWLLAGSPLATATPVSWLFSGNLTVVAGSDVDPSTIHVGDPFSIILHFDTSTPPNSGALNQASCLVLNGGPGSICRHNGAPAGSQYWSDVTVNGVNYGAIPDLGPFAQTFNGILVRNNTPDPQIPADTVDGYAFSTEQCIGPPLCGIGDLDAAVVVVMRGLDLSLVTNGLLLPESPSPSMNTLRLREFDVCRGNIIDANGGNDCRFVDVEGVFNSVSRVPEPATLALLGLGFAGIAASRRRKLN